MRNKPLSKLWSTLSDQERHTFPTPNPTIAERTDTQQEDKNICATTDQPQIGYTQSWSRSHKQIPTKKLPAKNNQRSTAAHSTSIHTKQFITYRESLAQLYTNVNAKPWRWRDRKRLVI